ncbi:hypothetical protein [Streptomyces sp. NPDC058989]|uniref:hypothetical protein n=1 Tax=Streptomyces sp. NPDC058989 TaxID=3346686 RepID=UPI003675E801
MKAAVELCVSTDGKTMNERLSTKCYMSNPISPWWDFGGSCSTSSSTYKVTKDGSPVHAGKRIRYAGPGSYTFELDLHASGTEHNGRTTTNFWANGQASYTLDFTTPGSGSAAVLEGAYGDSYDGRAMRIANQGKEDATDVVLRLDTREYSDAPSEEAASALAAYRVALQHTPRDEASVAEAKRKAAAFQDNQGKHTKDERCLSNAQETVCDLGTIKAGEETEVTLNDVPAGVEDFGEWSWETTAGNDPVGDNGRLSPDGDRY